MGRTRNKAFKQCVCYKFDTYSCTIKNLLQGYVQHVDLKFKYGGYVLNIVMLVSQTFTIVISNHFSRHQHYCVDINFTNG